MRKTAVQRVREAQADATPHVTAVMVSGSAGYAEEDYCDSCGRHVTECRCAGCDCCELCMGHSCSSFPEYCCVGYCGARGKPGHFRTDSAPDPNHPTLNYPERR
jgi:hypothetical protein